MTESQVCAVPGVLECARPPMHYHEAWLGAACGQERLVDPKISWLAIGKAAVSGAQLAIGMVQKAGVTVADAAHGILEGPTYLIHKKLIAEDGGEMHEVKSAVSRFDWWAKLKQKIFKDSLFLEKLNYGLISIPAVGAVALAATSLVENAGKIISGNREQAGVDMWEFVHMGATGTAFALALGLLRSGSKMQSSLGRTPNTPPRLKQRVRDFKEHAEIDVWTTAVSLAEAFLHTWGNPHTLVVVNASLMYLAGKLSWRFRPWKTGLRNSQKHSCYEYDAVQHDHGACEHAHIISCEAIKFIFTEIRKSGGNLVLGAEYGYDAQHQFVPGKSAEWFERQNWGHRIFYRPRHGAIVDHHKTSSYNSMQGFAEVV